MCTYKTYICKKCGYRTTEDISCSGDGTYCVYVFLEQEYIECSSCLNYRER